MKKLLHEVPDFRFSAEEKAEVLASPLLRQFDGSFGFLVRFNRKLKRHYNQFTSIRAVYFDLISKVRRLHGLLSRTKSPELPPLSVAPGHAAEVIAFYDNLAQRKRIFRAFPSFGNLIRAAIL